MTVSLSAQGETDVERLAYQARDVPGLHPMDASFNLPQEQYSHGVRRFVAENAAMLSFDDVRHLLVKRTGARVSKRQIEELSLRAAVDFDAFYAARRRAEGVRFGGLLVTWRRCDGAARARYLRR